MASHSGRRWKMFNRFTKWEIVKVYNLLLDTYCVQARKNKKSGLMVFRVDKIHNGNAVTIDDLKNVKQ